MRKHRCKRCGAEYDTDKPWSYYCPTCAAQAKRDTVVRQRVCRQCGAVFPGGPRAWYCPSCRRERQTAANLRHKQSGTNRPLGSTDCCERCGNPYTVNSSRQKYCPDCAMEAVAEKTRPHKRAYNAERSDQFHARRRELQRGAKVCVICGRPILADTATVTCSPGCAAERRRLSQETADYKRGRRISPPGSGPSDNGLPKSGVTGVTARRNGRWQAVYKGHYIGIYDTIDAAAAAIEDYKRGTQA